MTAKNAAIKRWTNSSGADITPCYDGERRSKYRDGELSPGFQTSPKIAGTDIRGITLVNNYNGLGSWFKVIGYGFGTWSLLGQTGGARVFLRDPLGDNAWHEVAAYLAIKTHRTYARSQLIEIRVQVGALGGSQTAGRALDLKVTVNGTDSNVLAARMINQGARDFWFVDNVSGNDATGVKNDSTKPFRYVQNWNAGAHTYTGIWNLAGTHWVPGDTIVVRGTGTVWTDQTGVDGRWASFGRDPHDGNWTGADPTGQGGTAGKGFYTFYAYPGEDVHGRFGGGGGGGGIDGADTDGALHGYSQYVQVAGFHIETIANSGRDSAPINTQYSAGPWIVNDNELGPYAVSGSEGTVNCGGWSGQMNGTTTVRGEVRFNYVHDIAGLSDLQNHGIYAGGGSGGTGYDNDTTNSDITHNWVTNIPGGSGIQLFWAGSATTMTGMGVHDNWVEHTGKYAYNIGESVLSCDFYNNIGFDAGWCALRLCPPSSNAATAINVECNTLYGWNSSGGGGTGTIGILLESNVDQGFIKIKHNVVAARERGSNGNLFYGNNSSTDANLSMSQNVWFDFAGTLTTVPSKDATAGIYVDPAFTNRTATPPDLTRQSGADFTTTDLLSIAADFYSISRPQGSHKWIGACEGVGT